MQATSSSTRRPLLPITLVALLLSLAGWAWIVGGDREVNQVFASLPPETARTADRSQADRQTNEDTLDVPAQPNSPENPGRRSLDPSGSGLRADDEIADRARTFEGPELDPPAAGERTVVELQFDPTQTRLTGQFLDARSRPLRDRRFYLNGAVQVGEDLIQFYATTRSDRAGRFTFAIEAPSLARAPATLLIRGLLPRPTVGAVMEIEVHAGTVDLGRLVLSPPAILAAGRVIDTDGVAVSGIDIELQESKGAPENSKPQDSRSDEHGDFEVRGWSHDSTLQIIASGNRVLPQDPVAVPRGACNLRLFVQLVSDEQH